MRCCPFITTRVISLTIVLTALGCESPGAVHAQAAPPDPLLAARIAAVDRVIDAAIEKGDAPGAVLLVGHRGAVVYRKSYGHRALEPTKEPMTADTVFDMASLTKPIATATSVMLLVERGKVDPAAPVARYIPEFGRNGKESITVEQLLLHRGGLIPDNHLRDYQDGAERAMENIYALRPQTTPGAAFKYTDVGFIVLGELVKRVDGRPLDQFAAEEIFKPLGMSHTAFSPPAEWKPRTAPAEQRDGRWMRGEVHDPRAYLLGGVAGHAGLFSNVDDLARYAFMLLGGGQLNGKRILKESTVANFTRGRWLPDGTSGRALGWDADTGYSSPRGMHFPRGISYGHTGFTGTSIWIDPVSQTFVILLTNRVHPTGKGNTIALRRNVATVVAQAIPPKRDTASVLTGVDVLARDGFKQLDGARVALITNHTGRDRRGLRTIDLLHKAENVDLAAIFSPEHGLFGKLEGNVGHTVDEATGVKVLSLYGETRRPTAEMLAGVDTIVFDIQDIGARFYTYITTLGYAMEEAAKHGKRVVVLDRPNPIAPLGVRGPLADEDKLSFIHYRPIPLVHGMTVGELAAFFNKEYGISCDLTVVKMQGWRRSMWFDETGLTWINPSPNMRNTTQTLLYPGVALIEGCNVSVGRGTDQPFEQFGAPWIDGPQLAAALNDAKLPGLRFVPIEFTPNASRFSGEKCGGVYIAVTDRSAVEPVETGVTIAWALNRLYGSAFEVRGLMRLGGNQRVYEGVLTAQRPQLVFETWREAVGRFTATRAAHLLYP